MELRRFLQRSVLGPSPDRYLSLLSPHSAYALTTRSVVLGALTVLIFCNYSIFLWHTKLERNLRVYILYKFNIFLSATSIHYIHHQTLPTSIFSEKLIEITFCFLHVTSRLDFATRWILFIFLDNGQFWNIFVYGSKFTSVTRFSLGFRY